MKNREKSKISHYNFLKKNRKGLSPVVATVLLIAIVIALALIVFLWLRGMGDEIITKFGGTNVQLICNDVSFEADYTYPDLVIINNGNVPIYKMSVKVYKGWSHETISLDDFTNLNQGGTYSKDISSDLTDAEKITLTPVLLGDSDSGEKAYMCDEEQHGIEISL